MSMKPTLTPPLYPFLISKSVINFCKPTQLEKNVISFCNPPIHPKDFVYETFGFTLNSPFNDLLIFTFYSDQLVIDVETGIATK